MTSPDRSRIALWSARPERLRQWRALLDDAAHELIDSLPAAESLTSAELAAIVSDCGPDLICTDVPGLERQLAQRRSRGPVEPLGLIVIEEASAEGDSSEPLAYEYRTGNLTRLRLPSDAPPSMLKLACQLLIDAVRLRRQMLDAGRTQQDLARLALVDPLTALPNRRAWDEELPRRIAAADASGTSLALAIFDLDCFKAVNDERGHDVGDSTLRAASKTLREQLRERDFVARIGGDEFGLLISRVELDTAERIVERVRVALAKLKPDEECPAPAASAGVAVRPSRSELTSQHLFQLADRALLEAKRAGRGRTIAANN